MTPEQKRRRFIEIWTRNAGFCKSCGKAEGRCIPECHDLIYTNEKLLDGTW